MKKTVVLLTAALAGLAACSPQIRLDLLGQEKLEEVVLVPGPAREKVLMIDVEGMISSAPDTGLFSREKNAVSRVFERLELAARDPKVKAVVLRIDTPGGEVKIERSATTTVRQLSAVGRSVQNAFAVAGISVSIGALVSGFPRVADEAIQFGDEVQKASARTGLAASTFAELAQAAKLADVEMDTLSKGFRTLQVAISQANSGAKGPIDTFRTLGVSVERLRTLKADQQLELLADRILALKDPTERARAGTELFGRAWQDLAPFIAQGSEGIRSAREEIDASAAACPKTRSKRSRTRTRRSSGCRRRGWRCPGP